MMEDRLPTRPLVLRAVRLLSQPRRSAADSGLVTAVALRLAAFDSDSDTAERLISASDRVIAGVSGLIGEQAPPADWSDTAEALAMEIAGRPLSRRHLVASRSTLGSADKLIDLSDRLRRTAEEPIDRDDLGRALALAVTGPSEMLDALIERERAAEAERRSARPEPAAASARPAPARPTTSDRGVSLRALDGGLPGR
ncbi:MAG TPA: hypothetical protein VFY84_09770 [Jiangellales bacterium]|nr:hypothetical protein [Jiangellales bacterium]